MHPKSSIEIIEIVEIKRSYVCVLFKFQIIFFYNIQHHTFENIQE